MNAIRCLAVLALTAMGACASAGTPAENAANAAPADSRNADVITSAELADPSLASGDLLATIQRLRPRFLMTRGAISASNAAAGSVQVSVDGGALQSVATLRSITTSHVAEVRYLSRTEAAQRFGTNAGSGSVILVRSR